MALVAIKTSAGNGYCQCLCGCYNLANLRDDATGKAYCAACGKDHLERNAGIGLAKLPPSHAPDLPGNAPAPPTPAPADPPGRLR